jgi:hypothetical protein
MEAPLVNSNGPIVIEKQALANKQDVVPQKVTGGEEKKKEKPPRDPKYTQPKWCPRGLNKTQRRKLQRARCKKQRREALQMVDDQVQPPNVQRNHLEASGATPAPAGPAKPATPTVEVAKLAPGQLSQPHMLLLTRLA